jgi:hypothetical protein
MRRTSVRLRRWASLSALASAALAASSGSGEAAIIYQAAHGVGPGAILPLPGGNQRALVGRGNSFLIHLTTFPKAFFGPKGNLKTLVEQGAQVILGPDGSLYAGGVAFRRRAGTAFRPPIAFAGPGQTFNQVGSGVGSARLGYHTRGGTKDLINVFYNYGPRLHHFPFWSRRNYQSFGPTFRHKVRVRTGGSTINGAGSVSFARSSYRTHYSLIGYGTQYALFSFDVGSQTDYGWLELSLGGVPGSEPFIRAIGYAYDTSGKPIPAGAIAGAIPEPKHLPLALGALALGAVGVREWRKKRSATA